MNATYLKETQIASLAGLNPEYRILPWGLHGFCNVTNWLSPTKSEIGNGLRTMYTFVSFKHLGEIVG